MPQASVVSKLRTLGKVAEIKEGKCRAFQIEGLAVAVFNVSGEFYALEDQCTHAEVQLSAGWVDDNCVSCPWHGAQFDLKTGEALSLPAIEAVRTFPVQIIGDEIAIEVE